MAVFACLKNSFRRAVLGCVAAFGLAAPFNASAQIKVNLGNGWKGTVHTEHTVIGHYFDAPWHAQALGYNVTVPAYRWHTYHNHWVIPAREGGQGARSLPDTYDIIISKGKNEIHLMGFQHKFEQQHGQTGFVTGTFNGQPFQRHMHIESLGIDRNRHEHMTFEGEIGYARRVVLAQGYRGGTLSYLPCVSVGFAVGGGETATHDAAGAYTVYKEKFGFRGVGGSLRNRLEWHLPRAHMHVFFENKLSVYHREQALLDGTQTYTLAYMANTVGLSIKVPAPKKRAATALL